MYTDSTPLGFGKHKFNSLARVPAAYLLDLYKQKINNPELIAYVESNMEKLQARLQGKTSAPDLVLPCTKITYVSEKDAKFELRQIQGKAQEHKKPQRCYECEKCGGWHLTSIPREDWKIIQSVKKKKGFQE